MKIYKLYDNQPLNVNRILKVRDYLKHNSNFALIEIIRKYEMLKKENE